MYTFSNKLKMTSFILMAVGLLGIGVGFMSAPGTVEEAKAMVASHDEHASEATHVVAEDHGEEVHSEGHDASHDEHLLHQ